MIYLDNSATSNFKPQCVFDAVFDDLKNSSNSGRSGHKLAIDNAIKIENCRQYLLDQYNATNHNLVFTKNTTEALNLAIFGSLNFGSHVVTTCFEHNSVLRPLQYLSSLGKISYSIAYPENHQNITFSDIIKKIRKNTAMVIINGVSNVNGSKADIDGISSKLSKKMKLLVDGAQASPLYNFDLDKNRIDMFAMPGHKGLHSPQGTGFLIFSKDIELKPMLYGGTGTASHSLTQPLEAPECYEAGTLNSGGIHALHQGAKWSFDNREKYFENMQKLSSQLIYGLKDLGAIVYTDNKNGVVSFNLPDKSCTLVADMLDVNFDIATRSGLHCAPLAHKFLNTTEIGTVRASVGIESTDKEIENFLNALEIINNTKNISI